MIHFRCRCCDRCLHVWSAHRGRVYHCPECGEVGAVPDFRPVSQPRDPRQSSLDVPVILIVLGGGLFGLLLLLICYVIIAS